MEYFLAIKKNGVLIQGTTWINLENIKLNGRIQTQKKYIYCRTAYIRKVQNKPICRGMNKFSGC